MNAYRRSLIHGRFRWLTPLLRILAEPADQVLVFRDGECYENRDPYYMAINVERHDGHFWATGCDKPSSTDVNKAVQKLYSEPIWMERWNTGKRRVRRLVPERKRWQAAKIQER